MMVGTDPNLRDVPKISDKIAQRMAEGKNFFSFEYFPPKTASGVDNLHSRIDRMAALEPLFCDITWGARGSTATLTMDIAGKIQQYQGLDCMMHLTCTNMPPGMAREALEDAKNLGLHNILALRGDPPEGEEWKAAEGGFAHAIDLVKFIREQYGDYFGICVAGYPEGHPDGSLSGTLTYQQEMDNLKAKVDAGADLIITQMFFDVDGFLTFVKRCREMGIKVPILPGILPIMNYGGFEKMTGFCKTKVPEALKTELEKVKDDAAAVKELGIRYGIDMCKKILHSGLSPGLHFYSLNLEASVLAIVENLDLVSKTESIRSLPFRPSTLDARRGEKVRPVYWANKFKSYLYRTASWEKYPESQWSNGTAKAITAPRKQNVLKDEPISPETKKKLLGEVGEISSIDAVNKLFTNYYAGKLPSLPWFEMDGLTAQMSLLSKQLEWMSSSGFLPINALPRANGALSTDPIVGWGGSDGLIYQKSYVEFFAPSDKVGAVLETAAEFPSIGVSVLSGKDTEIQKKGGAVGSNAVSWGVFPNSEILQPLVLDDEGFKAWRDEAFAAWSGGLGDLFDEGSPSREVIDKIVGSYSLVSVVDNDFVQGDVFRVITRALKN